MKARTTLRALDEARYRAEQAGDWQQVEAIDEQIAQTKLDATHEAVKEAFEVPEDSPV